MKLCPRHTTVFLSSWLRKQIEAGHYPQRCAPHILARILEMTCSYSRKYYREPLTYNRFAECYNLLSSHTTDLHHRVLHEEGKLETWIESAAREQFGFQVRLPQLDLSRTYRLYVKSDRLNRFATDASWPGLDDAFFITASVWATSGTSSSGLINLNTIATYAPDVPAAPAISFVRDRLSATPELIAGDYKQRRAAVRTPAMKWFTRSLLTERPIIDLGDGRVVVPFADLVPAAFFATVGHDLASISQQAQNTLEQVLVADLTATGQLIPRTTDVLRGKPLNKLVSGPVADFVIVTEDSLIVVETKTTFSSPTGFTPADYSATTAGAALRKAGLQLKNTTRCLIEHGLAKGRKIVQFAVLAKTPPLVNWPRFRQAVFGEREPHPTIISCSEWEQTCYQLAELNGSMAELATIYESLPYEVTGDWGIAIGQTIPHAIPPVPEASTEELFSHLRSRLPSGTGPLRNPRALTSTAPAATSPASAPSAR